MPGMEKRSRLLFAQVDHLSGEVLGFAIGKIMEQGACNVQVIPGITKKNRPGSILIIDVSPEQEDRIARFLAQELKVSGYHRIDATHVFCPVTFLTKNLTISRNGASMNLSCEVKVIGDPAAPLSLDIEHDALVSMQRAVQDGLGMTVSLVELRAMIESRLKDAGGVAVEL
jgi:uncharacterized protein (DUF111 family)